MPSSFNNKQSLWQKLKNKRINRSYLFTVLALVVALVVIIAAAIASNRSKEPTELPDDSGNKITEKPTEQPTEKPTEPEATEKPTGSVGGSVSTGNKIPSFILPVSGKLTNKHDPTLQVFSPTMQDYRVHIGVDLATKENAPVYAAADGKISKIWVDTASPSSTRAIALRSIRTSPKLSPRESPRACLSAPDSLSQLLARAQW